MIINTSEVQKFKSFESLKLKYKKKQKLSNKAKNKNLTIKKKEM